MSLFRITEAGLSKVPDTTFSQQKVKERSDIQRMLKNSIDVISPNTMIVAEEFGDWEESRRRIDLLGIDKQANLVVIELKRTEDGGHMELQSIRYAAMISSLTFDKLVSIYSLYLNGNGQTLEAKKSILDFLEWTEPDEERFAQSVKIILASAEFSKELTTSVMWLNEYGLDITCVKMRPYILNGETLIDISTVIPLPEVADYQIQIREKRQKERESRGKNVDFTRYDLRINGQIFENLNKRKLMLRMLTEIFEKQQSFDEIFEIMPAGRIKIFPGTLNESEVCEMIMAEDTGGVYERTRRFFCEEGEFIHFKDKTYVISNQWSGPTVLELVDEFSKKLPHLAISISPIKNLTSQVEL